MNIFSSKLHTSTYTPENPHHPTAYTYIKLHPQNLTMKHTPTPSFRCFYDTRDPHRVIVHKNYTIVDVVNCMLWPSVVIIVCIGVFLKLESKRRGLTFCGRVEEEDKGKSANKQLDKTKRCNHPTYHTDSPKVAPPCHHYHRHHHHASLTRLHIPSIDDVSKDCHTRVIKGSKDHRFKQLKSSHPEVGVKLTSSTPNIHSLKADTVDIERMRRLAKKHLGGKPEHETQDYSNCYNDVNGERDPSNESSEHKAKNKYTKNNNNNDNSNINNNNRQNRRNNNRSSTIDWADQEPRNKKHHHHHHHHHHPHLHHRNVSSSLDEDKSEINCKNNFHSYNKDDKHNSDNNKNNNNNNNNNNDVSNNNSDNTSEDHNRSLDEENESSKLLENGSTLT